jgi:hypothetical protein
MFLQFLKTINLLGFLLLQKYMTAQIFNIYVATKILTTPQLAGFFFCCKNI